MESCEGESTKQIALRSIKNSLKVAKGNYDRDNSKKTEEVVSKMLAKGFVLGKDALNRAKSFDDKHHLSSNASATVASIDHKIGLSEKLSMGTALVNEKVKEMDELLQLLEITKSAFATAEQKANSIMSNRYVSTGASWVTSALSAVTKASEDVGIMTKEKVERAEEEKKEKVPIIGGLISRILVGMNFRLLGVRFYEQNHQSIN
ncbi:PREDICTED: binding partner of ACD11 1-like [Erythranthe guttata]|uniref:binding partner of ACD11 1-like n=1 Tax=Erythranthe guttata TaxID=4155 RepID=UPI00064D89D9|nr:PREDICTED: binding partner of ACD11 1-like [Erythranthe guttata]|eukprot:XP_012856931.1 PREDICTED: binding partner of ACD11 1-like [Erythranthe guttata]